MKKKHIPISIISFIILFSVQYMLIFNTFSLRNSQYQVQERKTLDSAYRSLLSNDKLYPGAQAIIDSIIKPKYAEFEKLYTSSSDQFNRFSEEFCDTLLTELRRRSIMDSVFRALVIENQLDKNLEYALLITDLQITFDGKKYIDIVPSNSSYIRTQHKKSFVIIDGNLSEINPQNLITGLTVSTPLAHSYKINFSLHADDLDSRFQKIIKQMAPTLLLSFTSIILVVGLYYLTYRNWIRQKKMTEMTSDFLNSITHEFNTPITTIAVANKTLQNMELPVSMDKKQEITNIVQRQIVRLQKLIKQALNITQLNKYELQKEEYVLDELLTEIVNDYKLSLSGNTEILIDNPEVIKKIKIKLNKFLFITTIYNIFDNAIKYNISELKVIQVSFTKKENKVAICIQDNGIGLSDKQRKSIFQKFYRGSSSNKLPGLGLGLFYVMKVAEAHEWNLELESEINKGSKFYVWMDVIHP
ncbi:sensor histidine kinase [Sphingobacterium hungaricum]|uniref:histidine kinase n=1 Tax=Sphingobacterium hungaricum TaxID=2082723 RepID=A0A928YRQ3_9SPHI|nr:HAMP domain-containing sensor histidine kinase [Sphingobacterium hungaricum]MBE8714420.1 hypothetical protein [Sphingobacterium hungaricum]